MRVSTGVEWAMHTAVLLAQAPEGAWTSRRTIAEFYDLPEPYLAKYLRRLVTAWPLQRRKSLLWTSSRPLRARRPRSPVRTSVVTASVPPRLRNAGASASFTRSWIPPMRPGDPNSRRRRSPTWSQSFPPRSSTAPRPSSPTPHQVRTEKPENPEGRETDAPTPSR